MSDIFATRKKGESFDAMFRRWSRRVQQSGKVLNVRAGRYFTKKLTKNKAQEKALRGMKIGEKREYLLKSGKVKEEDLRQKRRRR
jgi:ribosomal protein S21